MRRHLLLRIGQLLQRNYYNFSNLPLKPHKRWTYSLSHHIDMGKWLTGRVHFLGGNKHSKYTIRWIGVYNLRFDCSSTPSIVHEPTDVVPLRLKYILWSFYSLTEYRKRLAPSWGGERITSHISETVYCSFFFHNPQHFFRDCCACPMKEAIIDEELDTSDTAAGNFLSWHHNKATQILERIHLTNGHSSRKYCRNFSIEWLLVRRNDIWGRSFL